jgi:hypothetical protein
MGRISKGFSLLLVIILSISILALFTDKPASAQSIPKPSVPQFTVQYIYNSHYVQPTTTTDPYTGQTTSQGGYYTQSTPIIKITIKNQSFTKYFDTSINKTISIFYQVRVKGHFSQDWAVITYWDATAQNVEFPTNYPEQDYSSQYTVLQYHDGIPSNGKMDFQVQAGIGTITNVADSDSWLASLYQPDYVLSGESSGWSSIQTLTIQEGSNSTAVLSNLTSLSSPTQTPSPTPTVPEFPILVILPLFVVISFITAKFLRRKHLLKAYN